MSSEPNEASLVLNQLRSSLGGSQYSQTAVYAALVLVVGGFFLLFCALFALWHRLREVYASRANLRYLSERMGGNTNALKPSLRESVKQVYHTTEETMCRELGLDAAIYMRTLRMIFYMFAVLTVVLFGTAAPINIVFNLRTKYVTNLTKRDALLLLTPTLLYGDQMIPHVVLGWIANICLFAILWHNYTRVLAMREAKYASEEFQSEMINRTVMVVNLPRNARSTESVKRILSVANPRIPPQKVVISRNLPGVRGFVVAYNKQLLQYEHCVTDGKPEQLCRTLVSDLHTRAQEIEEARISKVGAMNHYGFGIYRTVKDVQLAARAKTLTEDFTVRAAVPPNQIVWENMNLSAADRCAKQLLLNALYGLLLLVWIIPAAFIGCFLANLSRLAAIWPAFGTAMQQSPVGFAVLQGILAPTVTSLFFSSLPAIFRKFTHLQGEITRSERENEVLRKLYVFFFIDNYFIFSFIGVVWDIIAQVLEQTESTASLSFHEVFNSLAIAERLATAIVNVSSFWVVYLLKGILSLVLNVVDPLELLKRLLNYFNFIHKRTPREKAEKCTPQPFQYAKSFLNILFYATIALGFTTIQPLVLPIALVIFSLAIPLQKYVLVQMRTTKYETNGMYWPLVVNILLFALGFGNLMLLCVVWVQSSWRIAVGAVPMAASVVVFKVVTAVKFNQRFYYPETGEFELELGNGTNSPALTEHELRQLQDPAYYEDLKKPVFDFDEALRSQCVKLNLLPKNLFDVESKSDSTSELVYDVGAVKLHSNLSSVPNSPVEPQSVYEYVSYPQLTRSADEDPFL